MIVYLKNLRGSFILRRKKKNKERQRQMRQTRIEKIFKRCLTNKMATTVDIGI